MTFLNAQADKASHNDNASYLLHVPLVVTRFGTGNLPCADPSGFFFHRIFPFPPAINWRKFSLPS
jgi:hypothetical protein